MMRWLRGLGARFQNVWTWRPVPDYVRFLFDLRDIETALGLSGRYNLVDEKFQYWMFPTELLRLPGFLRMALRKTTEKDPNGDVVFLILPKIENLQKLANACRVWLAMEGRKNALEQTEDEHGRSNN
jgi:hypothetical protein